MFLPIGDSPNPPGTPWVNYGLLAANVAVYLLLLPLSFQAPALNDPALLDYLHTIARERGLSLPQLQQLAAQISQYDLVVYRYGFRPASPSLTGALASMFMHGGLLHLLGNMLFLWIYGDNVEHRLGRLRYAAAYVGTGLVAAFGDGLLRMGSSIPSVGASGAISGVLGLYFVWFPRNRVRMWIFLFPFFADIIELPARWVLGFFVLFDNLLPLVLSAGGGGVSYGAHIGGFLSGALLAVAADRLATARPERGARPLPHRAMEPSAAMRMGEELEREDRPRAALGVYQRLLADYPRGPGRAAAHLGAARVLMGPLGNPTGAYQHLYAALEEDPTPDEALQARVLLRSLAGIVAHLPRGVPR
jgi:rhomboid family protein